MHFIPNGGAKSNTNMVINDLILPWVPDEFIPEAEIPLDCELIFWKILAIVSKFDLFATNDLNPDIDGYPLVLYACHAFPCHLPVFCLTYSEHPSGPFAMPLVCPAQTLVNESLTLG